MGVFQNNLLAGAAAAASAGGAGFYSYQIEQSLRMTYAESTQLIRTLGTASDRKKVTMSYWFKAHIPFNSTQRETQQVTAGTSGSAYYLSMQSVTNGVFGSWRAEVSGVGYLGMAGTISDSSGWYHIVERWDTTQSTESDRWRIYLNGTEVTYATVSPYGPNYPSQNIDVPYLTAANNFALGGISGVGTGVVGTDTTFAEFIYTDGQSYAPTQFGEFKNGVWIPKDPSGTTFGNNGFHLKFENASDLGNDSSGNNNDFTTNNMGADHQILDSPTFGS